MPGYLYDKDYFRKYFSSLFNMNIFTFSNDDLLFSKEQSTILDGLHKRVKDI